MSGILMEIERERHGSNEFTLKLPRVLSYEPDNECVYNHPFAKLGLASVKRQPFAAAHASELNAQLLCQ